jgi:hypothetical protein
MKEITEKAESGGTPILKWCLMEVLEKCPEERECPGCPLFEECRGRAKKFEGGFFSIEDAIAMKRRVSRECWEAEMMCLRPSVEGRVFPTFSRGVHVVKEWAVGGGQWAGGGSGEWAVGGGQWAGGGAGSLPTGDCALPTVSLGIDFGFANAFVCLWVAEVGDGRVFVVDEYVQRGKTVEEHLVEIERRPWGKVRKIACDPAGNGANDQTAVSNVALLRRRGYAVKTRSSRIVEGLEMIRAGLKSGTGETKLYIDGRCRRLIAAMEGYRYEDGGGEVPLKDGEHDHLIDALRYWFVNRKGGEVVVRKY